MDIGTRVRKLRKQQGRTLQDISVQCGFTKSLLSKIENGVVTPPIATLSKIATALGVSLAMLVDEGDRIGSFFTPAQETENDKNWVKTENGHNFYSFASKHINKKMQPLLFTAKKDEVTEHNLSHKGEEFIYLLSGEMKFRVGNVEYYLKPNDSIYFDCSEEHGAIPVTEDVKYIDIFAE